MANHSSPIGLHEVIERVKAELVQNTSEATPLFLVESVEIEITFTVKRDVNGGINLQVVELGSARQHTDTQTVRVQLKSLLSADDAHEQLSAEEKSQAKGALLRGRKPNA